jgi:hypothetical protein
LVCQSSSVAYAWQSVLQNRSRCASRILLSTVPCRMVSEEVRAREGVDVRGQVLKCSRSVQGWGVPP